MRGIGGQLQDHLGRTLRDLENTAVDGLDGSLGALVHRVEGLIVDHLAALQGLIVLQPAQHCQIDGVLVFRARRQRGAENDLSGRDAFHAKRLAQRQLVLGQGAGLVRAKHVHARQFLDGHQPADNRLFGCQQPRPHRHRYRQHGGHRHGNRGHRQHQCELQRSGHAIPAEQSDRENQDHQHYRQHDQVIADL